MNDENWKKVVEKLVPLASEIRNVLDDNLAKVSITVGQGGYLNIHTMVDGMIYNACRASADSPVYVDEPF